MKSRAQLSDWTTTKANRASNPKAPCSSAPTKSLSTSHCWPGQPSRLQLPGVRQGEASSLPDAHSQHLKSPQPQRGGPAALRPKCSVSEGHAAAPDGPAVASGQFMKGAGEGRGGGDRGQLCGGSEWVTGPRVAASREVGRLWGEYQVPPCRGLLQLKAASSPLNPIKGRYYVSGNVCQS